MIWWIMLLFTLMVAVALSTCAVYFFCPHLLVELLQRWGMFRAGFSNKKLNIGDFEFSYIERGTEKTTKATIVLVHGFSSSKDVWCQMSHAIPMSYHLIALDLPGHGKTTRKHHDDFTVPAQVRKLHQFIQALGIDKIKFHLAGISMGGHIVGVYAAKHPSIVASVILMCPAGIEAPHHSEFINDVVKNGEKNYLIPETPEDFQKMINKVLHKKVTLPFFISKLFADVRKPCNDFYQKVLEDIVHPDHRFLLHHVLEDIHIPTLVLWGVDDKIIHVSSVDVMKEKIKNCQVKILDRCGHAIFLERPWKTAKLMNEFLSSLENIK